MKATVSISIVVDVDVDGKDLYEALDNAKKLNLLDIIDFKGDHIDSSKITVRSVWSDGDWLDNRETTF